MLSAILVVFTQNRTLPPIKWLPTAEPNYNFEKLSSSQKQSLCSLWARSAGRVVSLPARFINSKQESQFRRAGIDVRRVSDDHLTIPQPSSNFASCRPVGWLRTRTSAIIVCYEFDTADGSNGVNWALEYLANGAWHARALPSSTAPMSLQAFICAEVTKPTRIIVDKPKELALYLGKNHPFVLGPEAPSSTSEGKDEFSRFEFHRAFWIDKNLAILNYYEMHHPKGNDVSYESYMTDLFQLKNQRWTRIGSVFPPAGE